MTTPHSFAVVPHIRRWLPWLVLVITLCVTWLAWDHESQIARRELRSEFDFALRDTVSRIEQRMTAYEQMLRGVQSLFSTAALTNREALRHYVDTLQIDANFSGVQVIGVIKHVPATRKAVHEAAMHRLGFADYRIHPESERESYAPIIQREPYVGRNRANLGIDSLADPVRRAALETARDSGMPAITGKVQLTIGEGVDVNPSFVMYLPVFANGQPHSTVAQRRAHLTGWVYAAFHMSDFMACLYGKQASGIKFAI